MSRLKNAHPRLACKQYIFQPYNKFTFSTVCWRESFHILTQKKEEGLKDLKFSTFIGHFQRHRGCERVQIQLLSSCDINMYVNEGASSFFPCLSTWRVFAARLILGDLGGCYRIHLQELVCCMTKCYCYFSEVIPFLLCNAYFGVCCFYALKLNSQSYPAEWNEWFA